MEYLAVITAIIFVLIVVFWGIPYLRKEKPSDSSRESHGGWHSHLHADPVLEWYGTKEGYGEPPGMIRAVHPDELGFRGWPDMPGDYEGSSASAVSAYVQRSA